MPQTERSRVEARFEALLRAHDEIAVVHHAAEYEYKESFYEGKSERIMTRSAYEEIDRTVLQRWVTRAEAALADTLPMSAPAWARWRELGDPGSWSGRHIGRAKGIVDGVLHEIRDGFLVEALSSRLRAESEHSLLEQARVICGEGDAWAAVGTVLAGAALELRLRRAAAGRVPLPPKATLGQIINALRASRTATPSVTLFDANDDPLLDRWLALRNAAAHHPATFPSTAALVAGEVALLEVFIRTRVT